MAKPIQPTPKLGVKATEKFLKRVERDLKKRVGLTPTPKLSEAERLIEEYASDRKK